MAIIPRVVKESDASGAQVIDGSLRFLQGLQDTRFATYLKRTPSVDGNRRTYTFSVWCKRSSFFGSDLGNGYTGTSFALCGANDFRILFALDAAGDTISVRDATMANTINLVSYPKYRDPQGWYHVVVAVDTTQATSSDRVKVWMNGGQVTNWETALYPNQNEDGDWNDASSVSYTHLTLPTTPYV